MDNNIAFEYPSLEKIQEYLKEFQKWFENYRIIFASAAFSFLCLPGIVSVFAGGIVGFFVHTELEKIREKKEKVEKNIQAGIAAVTNTATTVSNTIQNTAANVRQNTTHFIGQIKDFILPTAQESAPADEIPTAEENIPVFPPYKKIQPPAECMEDLRLCMERLEAARKTENAILPQEGNITRSSPVLFAPIKDPVEQNYVEDEEVYYTPRENTPVSFL